MNRAVYLCGAFLAMSIVTLVATCLLRDGDGREQQEGRLPEKVARWMDDIDLGRRERMIDLMRSGGLAFYKKVEAKSDVLFIAASAGAAKEMLAATERGSWAEAPVAVAAVLCLRGDEPRGPSGLATNVCDLTRMVPTCVLEGRLPPTHGRRLEIIISGSQDKPIPMFSINQSARVRIVPLDEVLKGAPPADSHGVVRIKHERANETEGEVLIPDPSEFPMAFWTINRAGRRSNPIPVIAVDMHRKPGSYPRVIFHTEMGRKRRMPRGNGKGSCPAPR